MKKLLRALAVAVLGVGLSTGLAAAQTGIENGNGTDSSNHVEFDNELDVEVENDNELELDVENDQEADSGNAEANANTTVGDVSTGDAENRATVNAEVSVKNSAVNWNSLGNMWGDTEATIENGNGTNSDNHIEFDNEVDIEVENDNEVEVDIENDQEADSGNAEANANTTVGDVSTGDASNSFSSTTSIHISN